MTTSFPEDRHVGVGAIGWGSNAAFQQTYFRRPIAYGTPTPIPPPSTLPNVGGAVQISQPYCNGSWVVPSSWPAVVTQQAVALNNSNAAPGYYWFQFPNNGNAIYQFFKNNGNVFISMCNGSIGPGPTAGPPPASGPVTTCPPGYVVNSFTGNCVPNETHFSQNSILAQAGAHNGIMTMPMAGSSPVFRTTGLGQSPSFALVAGATYLDPATANASCQGTFTTPSSWPGDLTTQATNINNDPGSPDGAYYVVYGGQLYGFTKSGGSTTIQLCSNYVPVAAKPATVGGAVGSNTTLYLVGGGVLLAGVLGLLYYNHKKSHPAAREYGY